MVATKSNFEEYLRKYQEHNEPLDSHIVFDWLNPPAVPYPNTCEVRGER